ncbi:MAG: alkaline phosphatase [Corynebacterium sp.]|nr:alkaline phosphatase [Corynebacterium sp.]
MRTFSNSRRAAAIALSAGIVLTTVATPAHAQTAGAPKNIIYMIGDGMGYNHISSTNIYETGQSKYLVEGAFGDTVPTQLPGETVQAYEDFNVLSMATYPDGGSFEPAKAWKDHSYIKQNPTDSAAAGTAMATGTKTTNGILGKSSYGSKLENTSERAVKLGKSAGVVSSVPFSHATPAAWAAHNQSRSEYGAIATEMINSDLSLIMGAGHPFYDDDNQKLDSALYKYINKADYDRLSTGEAGWEYVQSKQAFEDLANGKVTAGKKYFGLAEVGSTLQQKRSGEQEQPYGSTPNAAVPSLETMTKGALNVLGQDPEGFHVMIEGGAIDWAGHANQTGRDIEEVQDFNKAVDAAIAWVDKNSSWEETLLIVTADHETGLLSGPGEKEASAWVAQTGVKDEKPNVGWYSQDHTNQVVPIFFKGAGSEDIKSKVEGTDLVRGEYIDNTAVAKLTLNQWWVPQDPNASDDAQKDSSAQGSAAGGLFGAGIMAAILAAIAALANAIGLVQFNVGALNKLTSFLK